MEKVGGVKCRKEGPGKLARTPLMHKKTAVAGLMYFFVPDHRI